MLGSDGVAGEVRSLQAALSEVCAALDPASVPLPEVGGLWSGFDTIERLASGAKCRLASRVERAGAWQREGSVPLTATIRRGPLGGGLDGPALGHHHR